ICSWGVLTPAAAAGVTILLARVGVSPILQGQDICNRIVAPAAAAGGNACPASRVRLRSAYPAIRPEASRGPFLYEPGLSHCLRNKGAASVVGGGAAPEDTCVHGRHNKQAGRLP